MRVAAFYFVMRCPVMALETGGVVPCPARVIGLIAPGIWNPVLVAGRLEAFFEPIPIRP